MKEIKTIQEYPVNSSNPYLDTIMSPMIPTSKKTSAVSRKLILDRETGSVDDTLFMHVKKEVDNERFTKVFNAQLMIMFDLTKKALRVFGYFMENAIKDRGVAYFNLDDCCKYTNYNSQRTIYLALQELLRENFIARTKDFNMYFINSSIVFNGDRLVMVTEWTRKIKKFAKNNPGQTELFSGKNYKALEEEFEKKENK